MRKPAMWAILGILALGLAAVVVIFAASDSPGLAVSRRASEPFSGPARAEAVAGVPAPSPPAPTPAPGAGPEAQPLALGAPEFGRSSRPDSGAPLPSVQPEGSSAVWENREDRLQVLAEMQRQRFESGMQGLNQRAARRAAMTGTATPPASAQASQAPAR
jgi:hypothetical protein